jgi:hypothetical protein
MKQNTSITDTGGQTNNIAQLLAEWQQQQIVVPM